MGFDVVLFADADGIEADEGLQSGEDAFDTCPDVSMDSSLDRLENVHILDAVNLKVVLGQFLLGKSSSTL